MKGATALLLVMIASARAAVVMNPSTECLIGFDGLGDDVKNGGTLHCKDCDPRCDADGAGVPNGSCTFKLKACINDAAPPCKAAELRRVRVKTTCRGSALGFAPTGTE